jgi:protein-disulfide isomerase
MINKEKEMSKRKVRKEQIKRKEQRSRIFSIALIAIGALFVAFLFIYPNFKPVGAIAEAPAQTRPNVEFNAMGDPNAPIKIEEYSDFQCPYCRIFFENTESALVENFVADGTVYFVYHSFGAFIGAESGQAAEAAYCAGDQGKFWEMHDIIFANQTGENVGAYTDRRLIAFAEKLDLNMNDFNDCFNTSKYADLIDEDMKNGITADIQATPSFIMTYTVNGEEKSVLIEGAQTIDVFQQNIEAALAEMGQ